MDKIQYSGIFGVDDCEFEYKIQKLKMADSIWWFEMQKFLVLDEIRKSGIFGVADYEFKHKIRDSKRWMQYGGLNLLT